MKTPKACLAVVVLCAAVWNPAAAQTRGATEEVTDPVNLETHQTLFLDPSPNVGPPVRQALGRPLLCDGPCQVRIAEELGTAVLQALVRQAFDVEIPGWVLDVLDVIDFVPKVGMKNGVNANLSGYFEVASVGDADVDIAYPLSYELTFPEPNSFACGERFLVKSAAAADPGKTMRLDPPFHETAIGAQIDNFQMTLAFDVCTPAVCVVPPLASDEFCIVDAGSWCLDDLVPVPKLSTPSVDIPAFPPLISICEEGFRPGATRDDLVGCGAANSVFAFHGLALDVQSADEQLVKLNNLVPKTPEIRATLRRPRADDLTLAHAPDGRGLTLSGTKQDTVDFNIDLVSLLDYLVNSPVPGVGLTRISVPTVLSLDAGDITVNYLADHVMRFDFQPEFFAALAFDAPMAALQQVAPTGVPVGGAADPDAITLVAGNAARIDFPQDRREPVSVAPSYAMNGQLATLTQQAYSVGSDFRLLEIQVPAADVDFRLIDHRIVKASLGTASTIEDHTLTLGGFSQASGTGFVLDPEAPEVDVTDHALQDVVNLGGGRRAVVYRVSVGNSGDVRLDDLTADFDLAATFAEAQDFAVACAHSPGFEVDPAYDGGENTNLLAAENELALAQAETVEVMAVVTPEVAAVGPDGCFEPVEYSSRAHATGVSPIGTLVRNNLNECTQEVTGEDIVVAVDLGAGVVDAVADYAVYGFRGVEIDRAFARSRGNVGTGGDLMFLPRTAAPAGDPRIIGDLHVGGDVHVSQSQVVFDYAQLGGGLYMHDPSSRFDATGAVSDRSGCARTFDAPRLSFPALRGDLQVRLGPGEAAAAPPGEYALLRLDAGSVLTLTAGTYEVGLLRIDGDNAVVRFDVSGGPVTLNLRDWQMGPVRFVGFVAEGGESPTRRVTVNYAGNKPQVFRRSLVQGAIVAPRAEIEFTEGSILEGTCHAERVRIGPGASFTHPDFLDPIEVDPSCRGSVVLP